MAETYAFFEAVKDGFEPLPLAASGWSADMVNGPAICGLMARTLEMEHGVTGFVPARLTVDLFRPTLYKPMRVVTERVRQGRRILVADAALMQDGEDVARATAIFLKQSEQPAGRVWTRGDGPRPPREPLPAAPTPPMWRSGDHDWSTDLAVHQNDRRKRTWQRPVTLVVGETPSAFVGTAIIGESTSMLTNWGSAGIGFINTDMTLALARPIVGSEIGVEADSHISADGIAVGSATLFDRTGAFGTCVVTALANTGLQVDFANVIGGRAGAPES